MKKTTTCNYTSQQYCLYLQNLSFLYSEKTLFFNLQDMNFNITMTGTKIYMQASKIFFFLLLNKASQTGFKKP